MPMRENSSVTYVLDLQEDTEVRLMSVMEIISNHGIFVSLENEGLIYMTTPEESANIMAILKNKKMKGSSRRV